MAGFYVKTRIMEKRSTNKHDDARLRPRWQELNRFMIKLVGCWRASVCLIQIHRFFFFIFFIF